MIVLSDQRLRLMNDVGPGSQGSPSRGSPAVRGWSTILMQTIRGPMQRRVLTWVELGIAVACLAVAAWPLSGLCSGRPLGHDCESWLIFGVNLFAPLGVVALACGLWSLRTRSPAPHLVLGAACLVLPTLLALIGRS